MEQKTVLLLHGGGLSRWNFRAVAGAMGDGCRVILPALDGHAGSEHDFTSIEDSAQRLIDRIDREFGGHVAVLGGLSLGAQVAVEMAARLEVDPLWLIGYDVARETEERTPPGRMAADISERAGEEASS